MRASNIGRSRLFGDNARLLCIDFPPARRYLIERHHAAGRHSPVLFTEEGKKIGASIR